MSVTAAVDATAGNSLYCAACIEHAFPQTSLQLSSHLPVQALAELRKQLEHVLLQAEVMELQDMLHQVIQQGCLQASEGGMGVALSLLYLKRIAACCCAYKGLGRCT